MFLLAVFVGGMAMAVLGHIPVIGNILAGFLAGIIAKGVSIAPNIIANYMGEPNEKTCFGIVQRGQDKLPPRNIPPAPP